MKKGCIPVLLHVLFLLWFGAAAYGQTVAVQVWNNRTPTTGQSGYLPNRGQSQHTLRVQYSDSGGSCNAGTQVSVWLEASTDGGNNWFAITPRGLLVYANAGVLIANGLYPALRVNSQSSIFNCAISAWYAGSAAPLAYSQLPLAATIGYLQATGSLVDTTPGQMIAAVAGARIVVYGASLNQFGAAATAELFFATDGTCVTPTRTLAYANFPAIASSPPPVIWQPSVVPFGFSGPGEALCSHLMTGPGTVVAQVIYRYE